MKASLQAGKPVIDEKNLNQILFSLPQLYELNQDLLRELEERMAHWYENWPIFFLRFQTITIFILLELDKLGLIVISHFTVMIKWLQCS